MRRNYAFLLSDGKRREFPSQAEAADFFGVEPLTIYNWFNRRTVPRDKHEIRELMIFDRDTKIMVWYRNFREKKFWVKFKDGKTKYFKSVAEASKKTGFPVSSLHAVMAGEKRGIMSAGYMEEADDKA